MTTHSVTFPIELGGDGSTVTDDGDPTTGLANGGHHTRFLPALSQTVIMAGTAVDAAGDAVDAQDAAVIAQTAAEAARDLAQAYGASLVGTSTSSLAIGFGSKTFATQAGKQWGIGTPIKATSAADITNYMAGSVTSYTGTSLVVSVTTTHGSGTHADWAITLTGQDGAAGSDASVNAANVGGVIYAAAGKTTPADADEFALLDSAGGYALANFTWANLKAKVFAALGVLTAAATAKVTPADADVIIIGDSAASNATKKMAMSDLKNYAAGTQSLGAVGTGVVLNAGNPNSGRALNICALTATRAIALSNLASGSGGYPVAYALSNTGAVQYSATISTAGPTGRNCEIVKLSSTTALAAWFDATNSNLNVAVLTDTGSAITVGTILSTFGTVSTDSIALALLSPTKAVVFYSNAGTPIARGIAVTITGTLPTLTNSTAYTAPGSVSGDNGFRAAAVSATQGVLYCGKSSNGVVSAVPFTEAAGVLTYGTAGYLAAVVAGGEAGDMIAVGGTRVLAVVGAGQREGQAMTADFTGVTSAAVVQVNRAAPLVGVGAFAPGLAQLSAGTCLLALESITGPNSLQLAVLYLKGQTVQFGDALTLVPTTGGSGRCCVCVVGTTALVLYQAVTTGYPNVIPVALGAVT